MTCANIGLTILALATFSFTVWPGWGSTAVTNWVVGIMMALVVVIAWTGIECKCEKMKPKK